MHALASPARFTRFSDKILPWLTVVTVFLLAFGLAEALVFSPADYQQGDTVRIMYVHVPSAYMAMMIFSVMAAASAAFLIWRHTLADVVARASAPLGAGFTLVALATGSLWGKPMWGTWWVWDARLTSMLVLFFIYIAYIALSDAYGVSERGKKICAVFALVGFADIPIIRFSVEWWNTLHQPASLIRAGGVAIDNAMLLPLGAMAVGFTCFYAVLLMVRVKTALLEQKIRRLQFTGR